MTEAMPFLQKYDITFLRPPTILGRAFFNTVFPVRNTRSRGLKRAAGAAGGT